MKFTIAQSKLTKTLLLANKSLSAKANLPILANILVTAAGEEIEVLSTDLETATKVKTKAKVTGEGKTTIPGRFILEFVAQLPEGEVSFEKLGEEVVVSTKGYSARFATMVTEDFPVIPKVEKGYRLRLKSGDFAKAVQRVAFCAALDEGRPVLTGVLCETDKTSLTLVATDGYRLSFQKVPLALGGDSLKIIMPAKALGEVSKLVEEVGGAQEEKEIEIVIAQALNQANFKIGNTSGVSASVEFTSRLIEGEFPGWQKIIPEKFASKAKVGREELIRLIRIASIFARDAGSIIKFNLEGDKLTVSASNNQVGSNEAQTEITLAGKGGEIAFNFRYLLEMLSSVSGEDVNFEMIEALNPGKLTIPGDENYFHIVMPVRLQS